ncbi:hypothetical protein [Streptantibioticus rubrisoli]|uniref:Regulator component n=1 Tax=Streptantibioticus rubrisoli TaxID=1387313 RepID=A0ABT1PMG8_9ACTN|nr:hypothetical protein [Streptantibioticus rubrisoli]
MDQLDLPRPFSAESLCAHLSQERRRPIHLHAIQPYTIGTSVCGLWLATDTDDHIFFEPQTTWLHQEHIILHEIAHLLFDHYSLSARGTTELAGLFADLSPRTVKRLLARTSYSTVQEQEAEMLASLIRTTTARARESPPSGTLGELEAVFGGSGPHAH